ncbi:hypothetical protein RHECNPAF_730028 [Rhizobium etli CNPAF512]|nr:hypothetical protein RHECNPAF_730028 [Rhizobium etli CNPAF512]
MTIRAGAPTPRCDADLPEGRFRQNCRQDLQVFDVPRKKDAGRLDLIDGIVGGKYRPARRTSLDIAGKPRLDEPLEKPRGWKRDGIPRLEAWNHFETFRMRLSPVTSASAQKSESIFGASGKPMPLVKASSAACQLLDVAAGRLTEPSASKSPRAASTIDCRWLGSRTPCR